MFVTSEKKKKYICLLKQHHIYYFVVCLVIFVHNSQLTLSMYSFFPLKNAGDLHIIILRKREKGV